MWLKDVRHRNYWIELFGFPSFELFDKSKDIANIPGMERRDQIRRATAKPDRYQPSQDNSSQGRSPLTSRI